MNCPLSSCVLSITAPQKFQTSWKNCLFFWTVSGGRFWKSCWILAARSAKVRPILTPVRKMDKHLDADYSGFLEKLRKSSVNFLSRSFARSWAWISWSRWISISPSLCCALYRSSERKSSRSSFSCAESAFPSRSLMVQSWNAMRINSPIMTAAPILEIRW